MRRSLKVIVSVLLSLMFFSVHGASRASGSAGGSSPSFAAVAAADAAIDTVDWGVYGQLVGKRWHTQIGGMDLVSEYTWKVPGRVLEQRDHMTGMGGQLDTVIILTHTYDVNARLIRTSMNLGGAASTWTSAVNADGSLSGTVESNGTVTNHTIRMPDAAHLEVSSVIRDGRGNVVNNINALYRDMEIAGIEAGLANTVTSDAANAALAAINRPTQQQNAGGNIAQQAEDSGPGWLDVALGVVEVAVVLSDDSGVAYNTWVANKVPELSGLVDVANAMNNGGSAGNPLSAATGGGARKATGGAGAVAPGSYRKRDSALLNSAACAGYNENNYKEHFERNSTGPDVQLHTLCATAYNYYWMYLNAIRQGYKESDANITYEAHYQASQVALDFYAKTRTR